MADRAPGRVLVPDPTVPRRRAPRLHGVVHLSAGAVVLALLHPLPASADPSGTSTVTVTVEGGALALSVASAPTNLGRVRTASGGTTVSGALGEVTVTDQRNAAPGATWVASVVATDFVAEDGPGIPASRVSYTAGAVRSTGVVTLRASDPDDLGRAQAAVRASGISGTNTARWTPTVHVHVPPGLLAGVYTGTITHSVA